MEKKDRLTKLEAALNVAEEELSGAEIGVRLALPTESCSLHWIVYRDAKPKAVVQNSIVGEAIKDAMRQLEPAINAMVLEKVQQAYNKARHELREACMEIAEL